MRKALDKKKIKETICAKCRIAKDTAEHRVMRCPTSDLELRTARNHSRLVMKEREIDFAQLLNSRKGDDVNALYIVMRKL